MRRARHPAPQRPAPKDHMANAHAAKDHVFKTVGSPVGKLTLVASVDGLVAILWENEDDPARVGLDIGTEDRRHPTLVKTEHQLAEYFAGRRTAFDLPLAFAGTRFQQQVWRSLLTIPFGETRTLSLIHI